MVFDNLTPDGLPYEEWLNDLGGKSFIQPAGTGAEIDLHIEEFGSKSACL